MQFCYVAILSERECVGASVTSAYEKILAVKQSMPASLLNFKIRGPTMSYNELLTANFSLQWKTASLTRLQESRQPDTKKIDTKAPSELEWLRKMMVKV